MCEKIKFIINLSLKVELCFIIWSFAVEFEIKIDGKVEHQSGNSKIQVHYTYKTAET